jgi:uncharacterized membrane protein YbaN (DUF454 family)
MFRDPATRRKLAILGIMLACVGIIGVIWAVLSGDAEWWTLIILIPVIAVMRRLTRLASSITERRASARRSASDKNE